jgi:TPP-dependent pyruvate/acetoin dehydrogenase alpha subunit
LLRNVAIAGAVPQESVLTPLAHADLELLLTIRLFERRLLELFARNLVGGTTHTCIGQEYIPVALNPLLAAEDYVFSTHRGHGHYLARFRDPYGLLCEIMGKVDGVCRGVGGSQHIHRATYVSTGVQGESIPIACGAALSLKAKAGTGIALAYIGDGTWGEGAVYEGLNIASLWGLPLVVVVENNRIAQTTPVSLNLAGSIQGRVSAFGIEYVHIAECDVNEIRKILEPRFDVVRHQRQPLVIEFETIRLGPHSKGDDTRPGVELEENKIRDWYTRYRAVDSARLERIEAVVSAELDDVFVRAERCALSDWKCE